LSSAGYIGKTTNKPSEVAGRETTSDRENVFSSIPARTTSLVSKDGRTVSVQPLFKRRLPDGTFLEYPIIPKVPIDYTTTAIGGMTFPMPIGTRVELMSSSRSMENYDTKDDGEPSDARSFHLSDVRVKLSGGDSITEPIENYDPDNIHIRANKSGTYGLKLTPDGKVEHMGAQGNIYALMAKALSLIASDQLQIAYGSSAGTGHALQNRAELMDIAAKLVAMSLEEI
jgi:hypothetical protein